MSKSRYIAIAAAAAAITGVAASASATATYAKATKPASTIVLKLADVAVYSGASNAKHQLLVTASGRAIYLLTGDSAKHPLCASSSCLSAWPAVTTTAAKPVLGKGVKGKLTVWTHDKIHQLVLNGHPLYRYAGDSGTDSASGQGIKSFGGTWELLTSSGSGYTSSSGNGGGSGYSGY